MAQLDRNYAYQGQRYGPDSEEVPQGLLDNIAKREAKRGGTQAASAPANTVDADASDASEGDATEPSGKKGRGK